MLKSFFRGTGVGILVQKEVAELQRAPVSFARMTRTTRLPAIITASLLFLCAIVQAKHYYVSPSGNDGNSGLSVDKPFRNPIRGHDAMRGGDTLFFLGGVYSNPLADKGKKATTLLDIKKSGRPDAYTCFTAMPGQRPVLFFDCEQGISMYGAVSYVEISGLEIDGGKAGVTYEQALLNYTNGLKTKTSSDLFETAGIGIGGYRGRFPHHIRVRSNYVHHCSFVGIGANSADYITIDSNVVHSCCWYTVNGGSAIHVGWGKFNSDTAAGIHKIIISNNLCFWNKNLIPWYIPREITNGDGIVIDELNRDEAFEFASYDYRGSGLITNNISFCNGGSGMHALLSNNLDFVGNIAWHNNQIITPPRPDIYVDNGKNCSIVNNIIVAKSAMHFDNNKFWSVLPENVFYDFNLYWNVTHIDRKGPHDTVADPRFVNPTGTVASIDSTFATTRDLIVAVNREVRRNFSLKPGSPAFALQKRFGDFHSWKKNMRREYVREEKAARNIAALSRYAASADARGIVTTDKASAQNLLVNARLFLAKKRIDTAESLARRAGAFLKLDPSEFMKRTESQRAFFQEKLVQCQTLYIKDKTAVEARASAGKRSVQYCMDLYNKARSALLDNDWQAADSCARELCGILGIPY
jgi:hypothetical protein